MNASLVTIDVNDGIAVVTLNRPDVANTFDMPTALEFREAIDRCEAPDVRTVLIAGAGERFCAGGDVSSFVAADEPPIYLAELATELEASIRRLSAIPKPVVAAVQGAVAGAGLALVLVADLVVAAQGTRFTMAYANVGLTPDCGVSSLLPQVVGLRKALDFTLNRRVLEVEAALEWGLVTEVVEADRVALRAIELAQTLAGASAPALGEARRLMRSSFSTPREVHAADEVRTIAAALAGPDASAQIERFLARGNAR